MSSRNKLTKCWILNLPWPSVKQASGSRASSGSAACCSSAGCPISTVLPSDDELEEFSFC